MSLSRYRNNYMASREAWTGEISGEISARAYLGHQ